MYVYVKKQHVGLVPGLDKFAAEYVSDQGDRRGRLSGQEGPGDPAEGRAERSARRSLGMVPMTRRAADQLKRPCGASGGAIRGALLFRMAEQ